MCETPLAEASKSPAMVPEKELDDMDHMFAGEHQEEGMMQQSSNFPWLENQVYRTSRTWRWLHIITNKLFCPNETERL